MPEDPVRTFLDAEQQANQLLDELKRLKQEVGSYRDARATLEQLSASLDQYTSRLSDLATRGAIVLDALKSLGTPEILARIDQTRSGVEGLRELLSGLATSVGELRNDQKNAYRELSSAIGSVRSQIQTGLSSIERSLGRVRLFILGGGIAILLLLGTLLFLVQLGR